MKPIGDFMAQLARDFSDQPLVVEVILRGQWRTLLGERISNNSLPGSFQDGILQVTVSDPHWGVELGRLSEDIRKRLNGFFGKDVVREIRFNREG
ncbi:MAG: DUF721 domain-containing protein [Acidobacteria bacterium]|nr:DUF721 domain-containing protein [Acidobacteriota bacterium]